MIKCFLVICSVANPNACGAPLDITPTDHIVTSPMECGRGGAILFSQKRSEQQTPEQLADGKPAPVEVFAKTYSRMEGDGSDIVPNWIAEEKRRLTAQEPQIK
jgi:hypothetical protein